MQMLDHPNIVALKHSFFAKTEKEELYLNLVLEYVPETVNRIARQYSRMNQRMPLIYVKLYTYQASTFHEFDWCISSFSVLSGWLHVLTFDNIQTSNFHTMVICYTSSSPFLVDSYMRLNHI